MWSRSVTPTIWTLIASFGLICGVTSPAGAQIAETELAETEPAHAPSEVLRSSSPPSEGSSRDGMSLSLPSLDPYHSLEKHVERVERVPIRLLSPPGPGPQNLASGSVGDRKCYWERLA